MALDKSEGVVKAQKSRAVFFTALLFRVVENRSSETLTVNQLSAALTPQVLSSGAEAHIHRHRDVGAEAPTS